jgi:hypothetical protein
VNYKAEIQPSPRRNRPSAVHDAAMVALRAMGVTVRKTP